jgi:iron(III) transport system substrate-binding protein
LAYGRRIEPRKEMMDGDPVASRRDILKAGMGLLLGLGDAATTRSAGAAREMTAHEKELYEAAKKEDSLTWYTAHSDDVTAQALGREFEALYPGLIVGVVRTTAQVAFQRVSQEIKAGAMQVDVLSSTDIGHYVYLKEKGLLDRYVPENAAKVLDLYKNYDQSGHYFVTSAGMIAISYSTARLSVAQAPQSWTDLLDPKWKDEIALGHPGFSGYVGIWAVTMRKLYGWDYFEKLAKNNPQIGRSINDTVTMINAGERLVAAGPVAATMESAQKGNQLAIIYPLDGTVLIIAPSGIMKGAKHPGAARLFMEYLLSTEASQIWVDHFNESMRPEVASPKGVVSAKDVKTVRPTVEEITTGIPEVIKQWRETFGV